MEAEEKMAEIPEKGNLVTDNGEQSASVEDRPATNRKPGQPFEIAVLALQNTTLFPETVVPLAVGRPRSVAAVEAALATEEKLLGCITVSNGVASLGKLPNCRIRFGRLI